MKCKNCGHTEVGMYKEIRGIMTEMGITKEDIKKEIKATIDSYIRSAMSQDIDNYIKQEIGIIVNREIGTSYYGRESKIAELTRQTITELILQEVESNFVIKANIEKRKNDK